MVTEVATVTVAVGRLKLCEVEPAATVTFAAGNAAAEPVSAMAAPPLGAGPDRVTVTLTVLPPTTEVDDNETELSLSGIRFTVAFWEEPERVAVTVTV